MICNPMYFVPSGVYIHLRLMAVFLVYIAPFGGVLVVFNHVRQNGHFFPHGIIQRVTQYHINYFVQVRNLVRLRSRASLFVVRTKFSTLKFDTKYWYFEILNSELFQIQIQAQHRGAAATPAAPWWSPWYWRLGLSKRQYHGECIIVHPFSQQSRSRPVVLTTLDQICFSSLLA